MKILEVELANMRTFQKAHYKVPSGLSLITGPNGSGKTTLQGISAGWSIWGKTPGRSQDYLVRHGERDMTATVLIQVGKERYSISRRFLLAPNGKGGTTRLSLTQFTDGKSHDLTQAINKETQAKINDLVGTFEVWNMTAYVGQREGAGQFLEADAYTRKGILREILSAAGDWDAWEIAAKEIVKGLGLDIAEVSGAIPVFEEIASNLVTDRNTIDVVKGMIDSAATNLAIAERNLASKQTAHSLAIETSDLIISKINELSDREDEHDQATRSLADLDDLIADLNIAASKREDIEELYEAHQVKIAERQAEINAVIATNESSTLANTEALAVYETAMDRWRTERQYWQSRRDSRSTAIVDTVAKLNKVKAASESVASKFCPECKQPLTTEHASELLALIDMYPYWKMDLASLKTEYEDLMLTKPPNSPEMPPLNVLTDVPRELGQDADIMADRSKSANALVRIGDAEKAKTSWLEQRVKASADAGRIRKSLKNIENPHPEKIEELRQSCIAQLSAVIDAREAQSSANTELTISEQQLATSEKASADLKEKREKLGELRGELTSWEHVVSMTGTNGVRQLIIDQSLGALESAANRWLNVIAPGFEIYFTTQTETDRETFDEGVVTPSGDIEPWSELSGAQSVAVALAVRLGMAEVGGAAAGVHYETLYLDEADAWLSGDYQVQFLEMLNKVADTGIDVVAITHIESVQDMVDQRTEIRPVGNATSEVRQ